MSASHRTPPETNSFKNLVVLYVAEWRERPYEGVHCEIGGDIGGKGHANRGRKTEKYVPRGTQTFLLTMEPLQYRDCDTCKIK